MLSEPAPAKINLTLHVTGRRADGYHLLESLVVFAGAADRLSATPAPTLTLNLTGPFAPNLAADPDNLVLRAARGLASAWGTSAGAALTLDKQLPVASGIGGGSADAAAALRLLSRLWNVTLSSATLHALATGLGADVPVCLASLPVSMAGIGDILRPAPIIPPCGILLANPGIALSTQDVFRARTGSYSAAPFWPSAWPDAAAMAADLAHGRNDLQDAAVSLCPAIADVITALQAASGSLLARMSGSGATCFAIFSTAQAAASAAAAMARPGWWCWGGPLYVPAAAT